jgi:hypothetical protein
MERKIFERAISPEIIEKVHQKYNLSVDKDIIQKSLKIFCDKHDLWFDDVMELTNNGNPQNVGSYFALKLAFQYEGLESMDYPIMEPPNEYYTEHIINRLKKRGYSPWA